jgi:fermentation-respiration switch protein FrsA (DUF1100 family)
VVLRKDFWLDSGGITLASTLFTPPGPGPYPGLVLCHGMPAGARPTLDATAPTNADPGYPALAEVCAWEGFATLIFNFRGTGRSGGNFHPIGWAEDLDAVISWLLERPEVDASRIVLLGSSMGAAVAIYVAAHRHEVAGLVSFASPATMGPRPQPAEAVERLRLQGLIRDPDFPISLETWARERQRLSPVDWVGNLAPRPLLLLHGDADDVVSPESVYTLFERAGEPKDLQLLLGVGHRFRHEGAAIGAALEWLKKKFLYF